MCESFASKAIFNFDLIEPFDYSKLKPTSSKIRIGSDLWYTMFDLNYRDAVPIFEHGASPFVRFYLTDGKNPAKILDLREWESDDGSKEWSLHLADVENRKEDFAWVPYRDSKRDEAVAARPTYRPLTVFSNHVYDGVFQRTYEYAASRFAELNLSERPAEAATSS